MNRDLSSASEPAAAAPDKLRQTRSISNCVHKFGGTSLADGARLRHVADWLAQQPPAWVVVSAMAGVTDVLSVLARSAAEGKWLQQSLEDLEQRHRQCLRDLYGDAVPSGLADWLEQALQQLREQLRAIHTLESLTPSALARVQGLGEQFTSQVLAQLLQDHDLNSVALDAGDVLWIRSNEMGLDVDWERSRQALDQWLHEHTRHGTAPEWVVVTGFLAREASVDQPKVEIRNAALDSAEALSPRRPGRPATLGRNGSDYSATIFARLVGASEVQIWTDVDGVLSADPRQVPEAVVLPRISYAEACELAYFGAKVIHPRALGPAIEAGIPIRIRNTWRPELEGSWIGPEPALSSAHPVRGISCVDGLALLTVEGTGMIGVPGTAQRVFGALRQAGVSVVMISQGSSEHSICSVVEAAQGEQGQLALNREFRHELQHGLLQSIKLELDISVVAAVGDAMAGTPGIAARLFQSLAQAQVNVRAIAQGSSERNISVAVASAQGQMALRAIHAGFWLSPQTLSLGLIGPGNVGAALLEQLCEQLPRLRGERGVDIRVRAIANSQRMLLGEPQVDLVRWQELLEQEGEALDWERFQQHVRVGHLPLAAVVDCSASEQPVAHYQRWLEAGIHIITPNKQAGSGDWARYQALQESARWGGSFHYETTVGAGLPVIQTLRDLLDTGDEILAIEGILSGTLAWLFNRYDGVQPFSGLVRQAHAEGYTEPDPRDDLDGRDVARKLVILAREVGFSLSLDQVSVESLVPKALASASREDFLAQLADWDGEIQARFKAAQAQDQVLRYVARLDADGSAQVGLKALPRSHDFARLRLTDNIVQFTTRRYRDNPLVVQGPGAGREVTAAGVFADILRVVGTHGRLRSSPRAALAAAGE